MTLDLMGDSVVRPRVLGPDAVPVVTDAAQAARKPELAVLSAMAHGRGNPQTAVALALAATAFLDQLSEEQRVLYLALIESALGDAAKKAFEMHPQTEKLMSSWERRSFEKGQAEGSALSRAADIIEVLETRGLSVTDRQRERITSTADLELLKTWLRRAVTVVSADELFA